ncbi:MULTISPECIES: SCP2 sterol-binding domain-containing protein [Allobacillus]|uniref:SCP2 sterol-binding domain-containing protein n=1 Tax=Allobacillus salarius TaxID=1955272 RepID=A0A556PSY8_9BACI|nr:SCP2 sterol-binding domain-containing protein [Allobacillus salarius]TSJ67503.1 SCP2 sterol-binding domain-containing protein [Allobacillus salarius]
MKEKLQALVNKMNEDPSGLDHLSATYNFILNDGEAYSVEFFERGAELSTEATEKAKCSLRLKEENLHKLIDGQLNATSAFMMGKIKVDGNIGLALKLQNVLNNYR